MLGITSLRWRAGARVAFAAIALTSLAAVARADSADSTSSSRPPLSADPPPVGKAQRTELALPAAPLSTRQQAQAAEKALRIPAVPAPAARPVAPPAKARGVWPYIPKPGSSSRPQRPPGWDPASREKQP